MVKRPSLATADLAREMAQESGKVQPGALKASAPPSREDTVLLGVHVKPAVRNQAKALAGEKGISLARLVGEALNDYFAKNSKPQIA